MINQDEINAAITAKVNEAVTEQVANLFKTDTKLIENLRSQAVSLLVRNFNLDTIVKQNISGLVAAEVAKLIVTKNTDLLDPAIINSAIGDATATQLGSIIKNDPTMIESLTGNVSDAVSKQVAGLFKNDKELLLNLQSQAVSLLVRNFNLDTLVKQSMTGEVAAEIAKLLVTEDTGLFDPAIINSTVAKNVADGAATQIGLLIKNDPKMLGSLKTQAISSFIRQLSAESDIEKIITDKIAEQFAEQFDGMGLHCNATKREMTIMEDTVVVENTIAATNVSVYEQLAVKNATISGDLLVNGSIDITTGAWDELSSNIKIAVVDEVIIAVKQDMIDAVISQSNDLDFTQISINGKPALSGNTLGSQITNSTLNTVGTLKGLKVIGTSTVDAIHSVDKRVGINTKTPNSALAVWDDEIEIIIGKLKEQTAFIGTNRSQDLAIGVKRRDDISIDTDGVVTIRKLKLGNHTIKHGNSVPGYAGASGDLVLNTTLTEDNPIFAWYCLHDYSWIALKATI